MAYPTGELSVDLHAIAANWRHIRGHVDARKACGAVVKANAYGLGVDRVAPTLYKAGCRHFFVANLKEALQLRSLVGLDAEIFVLSGCIAGAESEFIRRDITPVLVSQTMFERWHSIARSHPEAKSALKVDTGMGRLGLEPEQFAALAQVPAQLKEAGVEYLMSHLACADDPSHPQNEAQRMRFDAMVSTLRESGYPIRTTLANSAGVFLGAEVHGDIVRPGIALYGGNPGLKTNPMKSVVGLRLPIIQLRKLTAGAAVGYGATRKFDSPRVIATVSGGYADGILRSLSNCGWGYVAGREVPIVGRISMDSTMFDVTDVVRSDPLGEGDAIEILGEHVSIDDMAKAAGTISYEVLTAFGGRYQRCYIE